MSKPKVYSKTFDITNIPLVALPAVAGRIYKIVGLSVHTCATVASNYSVFRISSHIYDFYGGGDYGIRLAGRGDNFLLPFRVYNPYFVGVVGRTILLSGTVSSIRLAGIFWYIIVDV